MKQHPVRVTILVLGLVTLSQLGIDLYLPSLPHMFDPLGTTPSAVQQSVTVYMLAYTLSQLIIGPLSDAFGRRPILLMGLCLYVLGSVGAAFSSGIGWLLWMRLLNGVGGGSTGVISRGIMRDTFSGPKLRRIASYAAVTWSVVPLFASVVGGYIQHGIGWRANFFAIAFCGAVALISIFFLLPETKDRDHRQAFHPVIIFRNYLRLLSSRHFVGFVLMLGVVKAAIVAYGVASPFLLQTELGLSAPQYGWSMLVVGFGIMCGGFLSSRLSHHVTLPHILWTSVSVALASTLVFFLLGIFGVFTLLAIILPVFVLFFTLGIVWPNASAGAINQFPKISGSAGALLGATASGGATIVSFTVAHLPEHNQIPLGWTELILMAAALLFLGALALRGSHAEHHP